MSADYVPRTSHLSRTGRGVRSRHPSLSLRRESARETSGPKPFRLSGIGIIGAADA